MNRLDGRRRRPRSRIRPMQGLILIGLRGAQAEREPSTLRQGQGSNHASEGAKVCVCCQMSSRTEHDGVVSLLSRPLYLHCI